MFNNEYKKQARKQQNVISRYNPAYRFPLVETPVPTRFMLHLQNNEKFKNICRVENFNSKFTGEQSVVIGYEYVGDNWENLETMILGEIPNKHNQFLLIDDTYEGLLTQEKVFQIEKLCVEQFRDFLIVSSNHKLNHPNVIIFNLHLYANEYDNINVRETNFSINENVRNKKFLCLNRQERVHRIQTIEFLLRKNLLNQGYVSCGLGNYKYILQAGLNPEKLRKEIECRPYIDQLFLDFSFPYKTKKDLYNVLPLNLDIDDERRDILHKNLPSIESYYNNSYFSIITERDFYSDDYLGFTEKVMKCFLYGHPFVVIGLPHTLDILRDYGFVTFGGFINESYDTIENPEQRFQAASAEIERLASLNLNQLHFMYHDMIPILMHNYLNYQRLINEFQPSRFFSILSKWFGDDLLIDKEYLKF